VNEIERPAINRDEGTTLAFSKAQARKIFDAPSPDTVEGLRDRAILSIGLQVGLRRAEIASLKVSDLHQNRGFDSLRVVRKGNRKDALAINPQTAHRIQAYLEVVGHGDDLDGALVRPLHHNRHSKDARRRMHPDAIDRVLRKYARQIGLSRGYSAHSMRATFITTALENGASLEDVQKAAGHRDPSTPNPAPARSLREGSSVSREQHLIHVLYVPKARDGGRSMDDVCIGSGNSGFERSLRDICQTLKNEFPNISTCPEIAEPIVTIHPVSAA
jgi:integrase